MPSPQDYIADATQDFARNQVQSRLLGGTESTSLQFKAILFHITATTEAEFNTMIESLRSNQDAIMATIGWGGTFYWDFDINPVLNIGAGSMAGFAGNVNHSAIERLASSGRSFIYDDVAFTYDIPAGTIKTSDLIGPYLMQARCSWALLKGNAQVENLSYSVINSAILVPNVVTPDPPPTILTTGPVVYDTLSYPVATQYKILIPTNLPNFILDSNTLSLV